MTKVVHSQWSGPEALLNEIKPFLQGDIPTIINQPKELETLEERHHRLINLIQNVKDEWCQNVADFEKLIADSDVDKRSYSGRYLPTWLEKISHWAAQETDDYQLPQDILERFAQSRLDEKSKSGSGPSHAVFRLIDEYLLKISLLKT
ncbi:Exodeoxyribonuclease V beta chain [Providencia alcalifaciens]|nr:Exodeoxyribonuclease V beta chain [Providencia alcalifaciens]